MSLIVKCPVCNKEHENEVDQFADHISAYGGVEAWQMWKDFALGLLGGRERAKAELAAALKAKEEAGRDAERTHSVIARLDESLSTGFLLGNFNEPIDSYAKRLLRVILVEFDRAAAKEGK